MMIISCSDVVDDGLESLSGDWSIEEVYIAKSEIVTNGISTIEEESFAMPDGFFQFSDRELTYEYTLDGLDYSGMDTYTLTSEKVNSGFTRVIEFSLLTSSQEFTLQFGDRTSDSHEDATSVTLIETVDQDDIRTETIITLVK